MNIINKLQQKSKATRIFVLWASCGFFMIIVIAIWISSFSRNTNNENVNDNLKKTKLPSLFESIKQDFSIFKQKFNAGIEEIKTEVEETEQNNEGQETE